MADDAFVAVVGALDQHVRPRGHDQGQRRVFIERHHQIDRRHPAKDERAGFQIVHRPPLAFQRPHRAVAVQSDHQPVAPGPRLGQIGDMAAVQDVETAVGEADLQPLLAPARHLARHAVGRGDLGLGRGLVFGDLRLDQLVRRGGRGAGLLHHHAGGQQGQLDGLFQVAVAGQGHAQRRQHRVAGAGGVKDLRRIAAEVPRRPVAHAQRHAGGRAGR